MEKPDLLIQIQKLQLALDQAKEQKVKGDKEIQVEIQQ